MYENDRDHGNNAENENAGNDVEKETMNRLKLGKLY